MNGRVSLQQLDDLINEFVQSELRFRQVTKERAQADLDHRLAVVQSSTNAPGFTETDRFNLQLRAENLEVEYQRLLRINCDWVFYASVLYAAKLLMAGDEVAKRPQFANAIRACLDPVLEAVADPTNIKRIREIDNKYLPMIVEIGTLFRSNVSKAVFEAGKK
jgi:hypothetical protein